MKSRTYFQRSAPQFDVFLCQHDRCTCGDVAARTSAGNHDPVGVYSLFSIGNQPLDRIDHSSADTGMASFSFYS